MLSRVRIVSFRITGIVSCELAGNCGTEDRNGPVSPENLLAHFLVLHTSLC